MQSQLRSTSLKFAPKRRLEAERQTQLVAIELDRLTQLRPAFEPDPTQAASTTRTVTMTEPATNVAPTATFTATCTGRVCQTNSAGTSDPNGDQIKYSWNFGDGSALSTSASPAHTYAAGGTFTITLTVTDGWNRSTVVTQSVTVA